MFDRERASWARARSPGPSQPSDLLVKYRQYVHLSDHCMAKDDNLRKECVPDHTRFRFKKRIWVDDIAARLATAEIKWQLRN